MKVSKVSVSRCAGPPQSGQVVRANAGSDLIGLMVCSSYCTSSGSTTGSCASGTGTTPQRSQCTMGIGAPQ